MGDSNWMLIQKFVRDFAQAVDLGQDDRQTRIGVVAFGNSASFDIPLNGYTTYNEFAKKLNDIEFKDANTNAADGLRLMRTLLFNKANGELLNTRN